MASQSSAGEKDVAEDVSDIEGTLEAPLDDLYGDLNGLAEDDDDVEQAQAATPSQQDPEITSQESMRTLGQVFEIAKRARKKGARRILLVGDLAGRFDKLQALLERLSTEQNGLEKPDFVLCTGRTLPCRKADTTAMEPFVGRGARERLPVPVYFVDSHSDAFIDQSLSSDSGRKIGVSEGITFLGSHGVEKVGGLNIAFLSGRYKDESFNQINAEHPFESGCYYTAKALEALRADCRALGQRVDVLLTTEMPDLEWSPGHGKFVQAKGTCKKSRGVRKLCFQLQPRYHLAAGPRPLYRHKKPQGPEGSYIGTFCSVAEADFDADESNDDWWRLVDITPRKEEVPATLKPKAKPKLVVEKKKPPQKTPPPDDCEIVSVKWRPPPARPLMALPVGVDGDEEAVGTSIGPWVVQFSRTRQRPFYVNRETGESSWKRPKYR